jgi:hypothetical protein
MGFYGEPPDGEHYLAFGVSPRGRHVVVMRNGKIMHDPHPSREGIGSADQIFPTVRTPEAMLNWAAR